MKEVESQLAQWKKVCNDLTAAHAAYVSFLTQDEATVHQATWETTVWFEPKLADSSELFKEHCRVFCKGVSTT